MQATAELNYDQLPLAIGCFTPRNNVLKLTAHLCEGVSDTATDIIVDLKDGTQVHWQYSVGLGTWVITH